MAMKYGQWFLDLIESNRALHGATGNEQDGFSNNWEEKFTNRSYE